MQRSKYLVGLLTVLLTVAATPHHKAYGRSAKSADIKAVVAEGRLTGAEYVNNYFRVIVHIPQPNTWKKINTIVDTDRAQLLEAVNAKGPRAQRHNFAIIVHSSNIPGLRSLAQYVRSVRHMYEREGLETVASEIVVKYAGHQFIQSILVNDDPGERFYKGISCTMLNGYIFGFWVEGANEAGVRKLLNLNARLKFW